MKQKYDFYKNLYRYKNGFGVIDDGYKSSKCKNWIVISHNQIVHSISKNHKFLIFYFRYQLRNDYNL